MRRQVDRILVTGAFGQIGTELTQALRNLHGRDNVVAAGPCLPTADGSVSEAGPSAVLDVTDPGGVERAIREHRVDGIYHLAARLSAVSEDDPQLEWAVNMGGLYHVLEAARLNGVRQVFWPSSIAVFGPDTPSVRIPQDTVMRPTTIYGAPKVAGGGTTDYAVAMFYAALSGEPYTCFVRADTILPMIYMPDCITAAMSLIQADRSGLRHHEFLGRGARKRNQETRTRLRVSLCA